MTLAHLLVAVGLPLAAQEPIAVYAPVQPRLGQPVTIRYNAAHPNAALKGDEPAFAIVQRLETDWATGVSRIGLRREGAEWVGEIPGDAKVASAAVYFVTRTKADIRNGLSIVFQANDGKPARCAEGAKLEANWTQPFEREMSLYPDNVYAHRQKWFAASAFAKDKFESTLREDLAKLEGRPESPDLLAALVFAHIQLGNEPLARERIVRLIERFPESHFVERAVSDYEYGVYAKSLKGEGPEAARALIEQFRIARIHEPRMRDQFLNLAIAGKLTPGQAERAARSWIDEEPDHPWPCHAWAMADFKAGKNLDQAETNIERALDRYLAGGLRIYVDMRGSVTSLLLPGAFRSAANISLANGHAAKALAHSKTAQSLDKSLGPEGHEVEGRVWLHLGRTTEAQGAFEEALRRGSKAAEASLQELYVRRTGNADGFEGYLRGLANASASPGTSIRTAAPTFVAKGLDGVTYDLNALKGRVVVLNFWFIGCAPCRVEMPSLNKLVEAYKSNKDVVFIAFANDAEKELRDFLGKTPFYYTVIANGSAVAARYGVTAFPGHFVIGKDGRISSQSTGGSETIGDDLKRRIERALAGG